MIRNGLRYRLSEDYVEEVLVYRPCESFTVDGIKYPGGQDFCHRPMVELYDGDDHEHSALSTQCWSLVADLGDSDLRGWLR